MSITLFDPIDSTSKFPICGMPIRLDTYKNCTFGCKYCFANRKIGGNNFKFGIGNPISVENRLNKIFIKKDKENFIFLDQLIANGYTWHCGGMSDPFQPAEEEYNATKKIIDITNEYNIHILFSTKTDNTYNVNLNPNLHSFQLSITNLDNRRDLEPNIPDIESRYKFFLNLKEKGFMVGIRIQPFIPGISDIKIFEKFKDADHFTIEGLKIIANNLDIRKELLDITGLKAEDFKNMGLLNLRPEIRVKYYAPIIQWCKENNKSYSIADNDMHYLGNNRCCCGDNLTFNQYTKFNTTYMSHTSSSNIDYTLEEVLANIEKENILNSNCKHCFFSDSQGDCITIKDFYEKKFNLKSSTFSPKYFWAEQIGLDLIDTNLIQENNIFYVQQETNNNYNNNDNEDILLENKEEEKNIPQTQKQLIKENILPEIPVIIPENKNYYGWKCPLCAHIQSPAVPFCYFCHPTETNIIKEYFIPYWNN